MLFIALILGNGANIVDEISYFNKNVELGDASYKDIICAMCYILGGIMTVGLVFTFLTRSVTYVPDENRELVQNIEYKDIEIIQTGENHQKEEQSIAIVSNDNSKDIILINTNKVITNFAENKYVDKYEIKEITENCFGEKKEDKSYEYKIYTPDETERNLISLYSRYIKNN